VKRISAHLEELKLRPPEGGLSVSETLPLCRECSGVGYFKAFDAPDSELTPCTCTIEAVARARNAKLFEMSRLPRRLRGMTFEDVLQLGGVDRFGVESVRALTLGEIQTLYIWGEYGTGKTSTAAALVNRCMARGIVAVYWSLADLLSTLRATFGRKEGEQTFDEAFSLIRGSEVLVLDEVPMNPGTDWSSAEVFRLVNGRYDEDRPTVFVSNHSPEKILPIRLRVRLTDINMTTVIHMGAKR
jgi:DNA replication protein DnaC